MKVVLFCGGLGLRMRSFSESIPKPMVEIGSRPVLWHVMRYYAHFGHNDFILCLGHGADSIKKYFLNYDETMSNDFVLENGGDDLTLLSSDVQDWRITFVDTGIHANVGTRLMRVRPFLEGESSFLANYADVLTDASLPAMLEEFQHKDAVALAMCVKPNYSFHFMESDDDGYATHVQDVRASDVWINGGFFILKTAIFDYMEDGDELVVEPFQRLVAQRLLATYRHTGFWAPMDSLKEKQALDDMYERGRRPWCVWDEQHSSDEPG